MPARARPARSADEVAPRAGVEAGRGLVEEEDGRGVEERLGDLDAAREAARERLDEVAGAVLEIENVPRSSPIRAASAAPDEAVEGALEREVLPDGELPVEARRLEDDAEAPAHRAASRAGVEPVDAKRPGRRAAGASRGSGRASSCRRRSGRGGRRSRRARRRARRRRARGARRRRARARRARRREAVTRGASRSDAVERRGGRAPPGASRSRRGRASARGRPSISRAKRSDAARKRSVRRSAPKA